MGIYQVIEIEKFFKGSKNDYITLLVVAKKAREILDDYPHYGDLLEKYKPTTIALYEFVEGTFSLDDTDEEP